MSFNMHPHTWHCPWLAANIVGDASGLAADVKKALGSANKIVRNGNRIVMDLDDEGNDYSYIVSKMTGERLWLRESEGV